MFKIDKDVPPPANAALAGIKYKYPFADMEVNDSFPVPADLRARVTNAKNQFQKKHEGHRFVVRKVSEDELRVWRVA